MSEELKGLIEVLLENIYLTKNEEIANNERLLALIAKIKTKTKLSLIFNIPHKIKEHMSLYPLKRCNNEHCFECLEERINQGFDTCEHEIQFTPYENAHIKWLSIKFRENE